VFGTDKVCQWGQELEDGKDGVTDVVVEGRFKFL
jgi:hypothetical protein